MRFITSGIIKYCKHDVILSKFQVCMHIQSQLLEKTGLEEVLDACGLSIGAPGSAVLNVPMITRARYMMEVRYIMKRHTLLNNH